MLRILSVGEDPLYLLSVGLVIIWFAGYCRDWSIVYMLICEDQESEKVSKKMWGTQRVIYREAHQQRKGDLQAINNAVGEWQEHIVFCSRLHFASLHQVYLFCVFCAFVMLLQIRGVEVWNKQVILCRCHYHGDYWWPTCLPLLIHL